MSKIEKYPTRANVTGKEKRQKPSKHYVFIVQVKWSDGSNVPIYRQYSEFHQFNEDLQDAIAALPEKERKSVTIPDFPAKKAFELAEISKEASLRRHAFDGYCQNLLRQEVLAKLKVVKDYFSPKASDINPVVEPEIDQSKRRVSIFSMLFPKKEEVNPGGQIKKSRSGSDLTQLEDDPVYVSSPIILESYLVVADYIPEGKGQVMLKKNQYVQVVEKHTTGWWFLSTEYGDGWGPATHLQSLEGDNNDEPEPIYQGSKYITTKAYEADKNSPDEISFPDGAMIDVLHKHMDGWWVIKYQDKVGYAPATFMAPFKNPHYKESRYGLKQNHMHTKRRSTLKNSKGKLVDNTRERNRDLFIYKKMAHMHSTASKEGLAPIKDKAAKKTNSAFKKDSGQPITGDIPLDDPTMLSATGTREKALLARSHSIESYEYINYEEMNEDDEKEEIHAWVHKDVLQLKLEEEGDYMNISRLSVSGDTDSTARTGKVPKPVPQPRESGSSDTESTSSTGKVSKAVTRESVSSVKSTTSNTSTSKVSADIPKSRGSVSSEISITSNSSQVPKEVSKQRISVSSDGNTRYGPKITFHFEENSDVVLRLNTASPPPKKRSSSLVAEQTERRNSGTSQIEENTKKNTSSPGFDAKAASRGSTYSSNGIPPPLPSRNRISLSSIKDNEVGTTEPSLKSNESFISDVFYESDSVDGISGGGFSQITNISAEKKPKANTSTPNASFKSNITPSADSNPKSNATSRTISPVAMTTPAEPFTALTEPYQQPLHIDFILFQLRQKKISRIYKNEDDELCIRFAFPADAASFGMCDIRHDHGTKISNRSVTQSSNTSNRSGTNNPSLPGKSNSHLGASGTKVAEYAYVMKRSRHISQEHEKGAQHFRKASAPALDDEFATFV